MNEHERKKKIEKKRKIWEEDMRMKTEPNKSPIILTQQNIDNRRSRDHLYGRRYSSDIGAQGGIGMEVATMCREIVVDAETNLRR